MSDTPGPTIPASTKFDTNFSRVLRTVETLFDSLTDGIATFSGGTITNLVNGTENQDAVNRNYVSGTAEPGGNINDVQFNNAGLFGGSDDFTWDGSILTVDGSITDGTATLSGGTLSNLDNPLNDSDVATKFYVDNFAGNASLELIESDSGVTYGTTQVLNTVLVRTQATSSLINLSVTDTTPTAANIVAEIGTGSATFVLINDIDAPTVLTDGRKPDFFKITLQPGSGVTFEGGPSSLTISRSYIMKSKFVVTNAALGFEAVTMYVESLFNSTPTIVRNKNIPGVVGTFITPRITMFDTTSIISSRITDNILFPVASTSEITGLNYVYTYNDIKNRVIKRNPTADSIDNIQRMGEISTSFSADPYSETTYTNIVIQNLSVYNIFLHNGYNTETLTSGSGYPDLYATQGGALAVTGGSGSGMTVAYNKNTDAGIGATGDGTVGTVYIINPGTGYVNQDVLTVTGGSGTATFRIIIRPIGAAIPPSKGLVMRTYQFRSTDTPTAIDFIGITDI